MKRYWMRVQLSYCLFYNILIFQKNIGLSQFGKFLLGAVQLVLYVYTYLCTCYATSHFPNPIFRGYIHSTV